MGESRHMNGKERKNRTDACIAKPARSNYEQRRNAAIKREVLLQQEALTQTEGTPEILGEAAAANCITTLHGLVGPQRKAKEDCTDTQTIASSHKEVNSKFRQQPGWQ